MTHNRPLREVAQTTRRSRSQPPHFRQRAACARRPGRGAVSAVCVVSRCETARINERANTLSGPSDKCVANHSYAFVPDGAVNRRRGKRQLPNYFESENARVGIHVLALLCFLLL